MTREHRSTHWLFLHVHRAPGASRADGCCSGRRAETEVTLVKDYDFLWFSAKVVIVTVFVAALLFVASTVNVTLFLKIW